MEGLKYCPKCGQQTLIWDGNIKWSCSNCDFVLFHNTAAAVAVLIKYEDELFLTVRNREPGKGKLDLSGGFTDPKESAEETCARELNEELGLIIKPEKFRYLGSQPNIYPYKNIVYNTLDLFFLYEVEEKFEVKLEESEIADSIWIKIADLDLDKIAFDSQKKFLKSFIDTL